MNIWILTIGNSDVQLNSDNNHWDKLYSGNPFKQIAIQQQEEDNISFDPQQNPIKNEYKLVPARFLGLVYDTESINDYYQDLCFPLLDNFHKNIAQQDSQINIDKVFYLLTDQSKVFPTKQDRKKENIGYWQDTIELESIIEKYLEQKFIKNLISQKLVLEPEKSPNSSNTSNNYIGLDDWDSVLDLVKEEFKIITKEIDIEEIETVYVSHQAGTPAISSAVQFSSLALFGNKVKFLVSNELSGNSAYIIEGSNYLKGIQIQQAKTLITNGSLGGAKTLLKKVDCSNKEIANKLEHFVNTFNIKSNNTDGKQKDFQVEVAIQRVRRALELIEIYFEQENYIQGITLLAAAQETFMKAAIVHQLKNFEVIDKNDFNFKPLEVIKWTNKGLFFIHDNQLKTKKIPISINKAKIEILKKLKFPVDQEDKNLNLLNKDRKYEKIDFKCTNSNNALYSWIMNLSGNSLKSWELLKLIGDYRRGYEKDKRNQLMHNLRGVEKEEIIKYLLGYKKELILEVKSSLNDDVSHVYNKYVKKQFMEAIDDLKLLYKKEPELKQQLIELANELNNC